MTDWIRQTCIRIEYVPDHDPERPWLVRRFDGGPLDGTWDLFASEHEVLTYLGYFLFHREGEIVISREPHREFERRAEELDRTRRRDGGLIETFAPSSEVHGL